jgi:hypothetical protein
MPTIQASPTPPPEHPPAPLRRRTALALFALLAGIYLLTASGHTYAIDEELMFGVAESLALRGSFALGTGDSNDYSAYSPGQSVAAAPLVLLGHTLALLLEPNATAWVVRAVALWLNPLVTAAIAALLYLAAARLGYGQRAAIGTALIYGLATLAWPHSKTLFSEPLTALCLFGAFVAALYALPPPGAAGTARRGLLLLAGVLAGLAPAVKIQAALLGPLLALHVALLIWRVARQHAPGQRVRRAAELLLTWGAGAALALGGLALFQWTLYGNPLESAYGSNERALQTLFTKNLWAGLYGLLLSPGKGLVWYALPLLLWPLAFVQFWRRSWLAALACGLIVAAQVGFYARVSFWHGDGAWGPRYLNIVLPFVVLPLAAYLAGLRGWRTPWRSGALLLLLLAMVPVQVGGLAINLNMYVARSEGSVRYYQPQHAPQVWHIRLVAEQLEQLYARHLAGERVVLLRGFAYSEGQRSQGEQVPRWTLPRAEIALRPPPAEHMRLTAVLDGCRPPPLPPAEVRLALDATPLAGSTTPCPARVYHLLLPGHTTTLQLTSSGWEPQAAGINREDGPLGVLLRDLEAQAGGADLAIRGQLVPPPPLPEGAGPVTIREWVSDYRYGHWDFWWWYLAQSGFAAEGRALLAGLWLALAGALLAGGAWGLRHRITNG